MKLRSGSRLRALAVATGLGIGLIPVAGANDAPWRVLQLEQQSDALSGRVEHMHEALRAFMPPREIGNSVTAAQPVIQVAQSSRETASINVKLGQLEEQMRVLNGQVEGLQFQMTQMQTFLERLQEDYEFRFQQLEGSRSGKTDAAPQSGSVTLSGGAPQIQTNLPPTSGALDLNAPDGLESVLGEGAGISLGASPRPLGTLETGAVNLGDRSLDFSAVDTGIVNESDADAQYRAGYDAVSRGDYEFAEDQFRQFVELFPDHRQAPEAVNWLGEALIQRGSFDEAAEVFFEGFEAYSTSSRAPDLLMKLGIALNGAGEDDTACRTFGEVQKRFPNQPASFMARLAQEMRTAKC